MSTCRYVDDQLSSIILPLPPYTYNFMSLLIRFTENEKEWIITLIHCKIDVVKKLGCDCAMIGERVKKRREEKKMSMTELAERAGVAKSYLSSLERNIQKNPSIQFLEKIALVLNVPVMSLLYEEIDNALVDPEWLEILDEAIQSGISKEQVKDFIEFTKWKNNKGK